MVNGADVAVGGASGAGFGWVVDVITEVIRNANEFTTSHTNIKSTVEALQPLMQEIEGKNNTLLLQNEELKDLKEEVEAGVKRVKELSEEGVWNYCMRPLYNTELDGMDKSLQRLLRILQAQGVRDVKEILVQVKEVLFQVKEVVLVRVEEGLVQVNDCKTDVNKISNQLDDCKTEIIKEIRACKKEHLDLTRRAFDRFNGFERSNAPSDFVPIREEVATLVEREALGSSLLTMRHAVDEALSKPSQFEMPLKLLKETISRYFKAGLLSNFNFMEERLMEEYVNGIKLPWSKNFDDLEDPQPIMDFDEVKGLRIKVEEGTKLIRKCSNVDVWTDHNMVKYAKKLDDLAKFLEASVQQRLKRTNSTMPKGFDTQNSRVHFCSSPFSVMIAHHPIISC